MGVACPPSADLAGRVWAALSGFVEAAEFARREAVAETLGLGRGRGRLKVLRAVSVEPLSLREIADNIRVDPPYATVIVDNLENAGLVRRSPHPDDRRRKLVSLTQAGVEALALAEASFAQAPSALSRLSADQLTRLAELVEHLVEDCEPRPGSASRRTVRT